MTQTEAIQATDRIRALLKQLIYATAGEDAEAVRRRIAVYEALSDLGDLEDLLGFNKIHSDD